MMTREEGMTLMSIDPQAMSAAVSLDPSRVRPEEHDSNRRIRRVV